MPQFKSNTIVDAENFEPMAFNSSNVPAGGDPIRTDYKGNWFLFNNGLHRILPESPTRPGAASRVGPVGARIDIHFESAVEATGRTTAPDEIDYPYGGWTQELFIAGDPGTFTSHDEWVDYVTDKYRAGTFHFDHAHEYSSPFTPTEIFLLGWEGTAATAQVNFEYNFHLPQYELVVGSYTTETTFPHLYTFYLSTQAFEVPFDILTTVEANSGTYYQFITLGGSLDPTLWEGLHIPRPGDDSWRVGTSDSYYREWTQTYPTVVGVTEELVSLEQRYKNIFVPASTLELMQDWQSRSALFPMVAEIEFRLPDPPAERPTYYLADTMSWNPDQVPHIGDDQPGGHAWAEGIINNLMRAMHIDSDLSVDDQYYTMAEGFAEMRQAVSDPTSTTAAQITNQIGTTNRRTFDFGEWVDDAVYDWHLGIPSYTPLDDSPLVPSVQPPWLFLKNYLENAEGDFLTVGEFRYAAWITRYGMRYNVSHPGGLGVKRTYEEVLRGNLAYSEDLFFKVNKYRVSSAGGRAAEPIQTYHLPNNRDSREVIRLVDTQLKYSQTYQYEITVGRLVYGTETNYTRIEVLYHPTFGGAPERPTYEGDDLGTVRGLWQTVDSLDADEIGTIRGAGTDATGAPIPYEIPDYWYHPTFGGDPSKRRARVTVSTRPSIRVMELPYVVSALAGGTFGRGAAIDNPPLPPDVGVYPYKGIDDRLLITLNTGVGRVHRPPVSFSWDEGAINYYNNLRGMNQNPLDTTVLYENDDPSFAFEVIRLSEYPRCLRGL